MGVVSVSVEVEGLSVRFGDRTVVDGVSFAVGAGERWGIIGESGSGKSLKAAVVAGLAPHRAPPTPGSPGRPRRSRRRRR